MSSISDTITSVEASILKAYCRTNRAGEITATTYSDWDTDDGTIQSNTLRWNVNALAGKHLDYGGTVRRIASNGATSGNNTQINLAVAFPTTPIEDVTVYIRDGFTQVPDSELLRARPMDRRFQMVLGDVRQFAVFGLQNMARYELPFQIQVAYQISGDPQNADLRWNEDAQAILAILQDDSNQPSGVTLFPAEAPAVVETHAPEEGTPQWFIGGVNFVATYTDQSVEA